MLAPDEEEFGVGFAVAGEAGGVFYVEEWCAHAAFIVEYVLDFHCETDSGVVGVRVVWLVVFVF